MQSGACCGKEKKGVAEKRRMQNGSVRTIVAFTTTMHEYAKRRAPDDAMIQAPIV